MILSALLSAVTGAFAGSRPAEARLHQPAAAQRMAVARPAAVAVAPTLRPAQEIPVQKEQVEPAPARPAPLPATPIETDRLIE